MKKDHVINFVIAVLVGFFLGSLYEGYQMKKRPIPMRELRFDGDNECFRFMD